MVVNLIKYNTINFNNFIEKKIDWKKTSNLSKDV